MNTRKNILLGIIAIMVVLLITIGASYAYFTANLTGGESATTITVTGGTINIIYNGGANINLANIIPDNNVATVKTFTVTGNNTTDLEMKYQISLVVETNTFSEEALKYKLISTNAGSNGTVAPSITNLTNIGTGSKTTKLGVGEFASPTGGNKVHTYNLEIYFPNAVYNQNIDQGKEIKAHIEIKNYKVTLADLILAQDGGIAAIESKSTPDFSVVNGTSGLYATEDEYGTSYYYRGLKTELNNNLIFGGFQWKIIRINGGSSIRIIYNGTETEFNSNGTMNTTGTNTQISGTHAWNATNYNDAKYVGYMYGGANGVASTVRNGTTSVAATYNETPANIKTVLDTWYQTNLSGKTFENQIVNNLFCNDRQLRSEVGGTSTGPGYGNTGTTTNYGAYQRLDAVPNPTLKCGLKNDRFTTSSDMIIGNGALTYPVGLITVDELVMAGLKYSTNNSTNYLYTNQSYLSISPYVMHSSGYAMIVFVHQTGSWLLGNVHSPEGIRPTVSISSDVSVTGEGSLTNPYRVVD